MKYMLDTDTCIYLINRHPDMVPKASPDECGISVVVFGELQRAIRRAKRRAPTQAFVDSMQVADLTRDAGKLYGQIRTGLEMSGKPIGPNHLWIAAHAIAQGLPLISNNLKEFSRVNGLKVETWLKP